MDGSKRLKLIDGSSVEPRIANFDRVLKDILKNEDELYERVSAALGLALKINTRPVARIAPKLRPQFAEVLLDRLMDGSAFATLTLFDFFGDGNHAYKVLARRAADNLASVPEACKDMPPQLSHSVETRRRSLSYAASDVLAALAVKAWNLDGADLAVLEVHSCSTAPRGWGRSARGAGLFADEKGLALLRRACPLLRRREPEASPATRPGELTCVGA